jgi:ribosomal protein L6P/L9E
MELIEIDIDMYEGLAHHYRIKSIPTCYVASPGNQNVVIKGADMQRITQAMDAMKHTSQSIDGDIPMVDSTD